MSRDRRRHVGKPDNASDMLERFEQDQERQARAGLARLLPRKGDFGYHRRERLQLGGPCLDRQSRVGGIGTALQALYRRKAPTQQHDADV
jgi:hypothetical protein